MKLLAEGLPAKIDLALPRSFDAFLPGAISMLRYLAELLRSHYRRIASPRRRLSSLRQTLLVPAHLRNDDTYQRPAGRFTIGVATVCRYLSRGRGAAACSAPPYNPKASSLSNSKYDDGKGSLFQLSAMRSP